MEVSDLNPRVPVEWPFNALLSDHSQQWSYGRRSASAQQCLVQLRRYAATPLRHVTNSTTPLNACDRRCHLTTLTERLKHRTRAIVHGGKKGAKSKN
jgi:hypothetical protein